MMKINADTNAIIVHGREALNLPYKRWVNPNGALVQVDISGSAMFLEIQNIGFRQQLTVDPSDAKGLRIHVGREVVETLSTRTTPYIIVDETDPSNPTVELEGTILRQGYIGIPQAT
jgi:hypothetical protein